MTNPAPGLAAKIEAVQDITPEIRILRVRTDAAIPAWLAGQYMELSFAGLPPRSYSIASAPHSNVLEFHIRDTKGGSVSSHIVTTLKVGDTLTLRGPFGYAAMIPGDTTPLLLVAGGMGLSQMKAIVEDTLHNNHPGPVILCWGVRVDKDLYLKAHFDALAQKHPQFRFMPVVETVSGQNAGQVIRAQFTDLSGMRIYIAGSPAMIAATLPDLHSLGARAGHIHGDDKNLSPAILPAPPKGP
jgi:ferredoxin-NAD(P)+ reductase (naphthalene dioxygenase ferredoxin-specific)